MKILNISTIIPLKGLMLENDIIVIMQDYLKRVVEEKEERGALRKVHMHGKGQGVWGSQGQHQRAHRGR